MKKLTILITTLLIIQFSAISQNSCLPEGIVFESQAQINSFRVNYPGCSEIEGDVTISGNYFSTLNGLIVLTSIGGTFIFMETNHCSVYQDRKALRPVRSLV